MTLDVEPGIAWIVGGLLAIPYLRQAVGFFRDLKGPQRTPPLGEEVAGKYATRDDLKSCRGQCDEQITCIRTAIAANDVKAEERSVATHKRIDAVYKSLNKNNRSLGIIIGALFAQGKVPPSAITDETEGD